MEGEAVVVQGRPEGPAAEALRVGESRVAQLTPQDAPLPVTGPPRRPAGVFTTCIPVVMVVREGAKLRGTVALPLDLLPVIARAIRNGFRAPLGDVKVVVGDYVALEGHTQAFARLGLACEHLPDVTPEESAMALADFIARHYDAALVHERLGGLLKTEVQK